MQLFKHQQETVDRTWEMPGFMYCWEPRVCKSLPQIITALKLHQAGLIDGVVILAPSGVHHDWAIDVIRQGVEIFYPNGGFEHHILDWMSNAASTRYFQRKAEETLNKPVLTFVCADSNGLTSERLKDYIERFVKKRTCLFVPDESHYFKNPQAQRTKFAMRISRRCPYRRPLSGTPLVTPFDLWSQFYMVDPKILGERFVPFKVKYGVFERKFFGPRAVNIVVGYRQLDELKQIIAPYSSWMTLPDVFPNLPEALPPERAYFELSPDHRRAYEELKKEYILTLEKGEAIVTTPLVMLLRLSQVARGFINTNNGEQPIPGSNEALHRLLHEVVKRPDEKIVVWCRFTPDVQNICDILTKAEIKHVRHDGHVEEDTRRQNLFSFQNDPAIRVIVGTPATGGVGKDFSAGSTIIFYSHGFGDLNGRLQAMSRVRGVNQVRAISQIDLIGLDTVDERCIALMDAGVDIVSKLNDHSELLRMLKAGRPTEADVAIIGNQTISEDEFATAADIFVKDVFPQEE